jgi:hypothetical protein
MEVIGDQQQLALVGQNGSNRLASHLFFPDHLATAEVDGSDFVIKAMADVQHPLVQA